MLTFIEKTDICKNINYEVVQIMSSYLAVEYKRSGKINTNADLIIDYAFRPCLIGQERNNIYIYTWSFEQSPFAKTFVALYDQSICKAKLIFTQDKNIDIVNASVNSDQSMFAFSVRERNSSEGYITPTEAGDVFKSYIAEIAPQNRVFSLNIEWRTYQKVQFLHEHPHANHKISHLLFFHHKESIALYHVPVALCDKRYVMSMQPSTRQIIGHFLWSKFDLISQRLSFVKLYPQDEEEVDAKALLTVVEFKPDGDFHYVLNFPLPIPFRMDSMQQQAIYFDNYFSSIVSANSFNLDVLTTKPGSFYICYQHLTQAKHIESSSTDGEESLPGSSKTSSSSLLSSENVENNLYVNYTICCVHGGYKLQCSSTLTSRALNHEGHRVLFIPFNDYIVAYLPGSFLHLLDISCEHEPIHNLLLRDEINMLPMIDDWDINNSPLFSKITEELPSQQSPLIFENHTQRFYKFELNQKMLFKLFLYSKASTRMAVLHACMCHLKDKKLIRKIIERVCLDPANIETTELIKEYLICAAYNQMKKMVATPLDLKIFPFSSQETSRGQVERSETGERLVYLFYKQFSEDLVKQLQKVLHNSKNTYWNNVASYLSYEYENRNKRFPLKYLYLAGVNMDIPSVGIPDSSVSEMRRSKTSSFSGKKMEKDSRARGDSTSSLPVLSKNLKESRESEHKNYVAVERIVSYVVRMFGKETKSKASNMCREYAITRTRIINTFWRTALKSLNFSSEEELYRKGLNDQPNEFELALFQIIERLKVILEQLCHPGFPGMANLFTILAFRCLSRHQFFEYLDACMLEIDVGIVRQFLYDADNSPKNVAVKLKLVSCLSKENATLMLKEWGNTKSNRYLALQIMAKLPSEEMHYGTTNIAEGSETTEDFFPLSTLLRSVKICGQKTGILRSRSNNIVNDQTLSFLSNFALTETESLISIDRT